MFTFCPMCQLPLQAIKISPEVHVNKCLREWDCTNLEECSEGARCLSTDFYHYVDYSHKELAKYRSSVEFVEPKVEYVKTPVKSKSPKKPFTSLKKSCSSPIVLHHNDEDNANKKECKSDDSDSDSDVFKPAKRAKRDLGFDSCGKSKIKPKKSCKSTRKSRKSLQSSSSNSQKEVNINQSHTEKEQFKSEANSSSVQFDSTGNSIIKSNLGTSFSEKRNVFVSSNSESSVEIIVQNETHSNNKITCNESTDAVSEKYEENSRPNGNIEEGNANTTRTCEQLYVNSRTIIKKESENNCTNTVNERASSNTKIMKKECKTGLTNRSNGSSPSDSVISASVISATVTSLTKEIVALYTAGSSSKKTQPVKSECSNSDEVSQRETPSRVLNEVSNTLNKDITINARAVHSVNNKTTTSTNYSVEKNTVTTMNSFLQRSEPINTNNNSSNEKNINKSRSNTLHSTLVSSTVTVNNYIEESQLPSDRSGTKKCPFYKRIPDTCFAVDAFQYGYIPGVKIYFLSHFHADHYAGLTKKFSCPIYCTQITANLVRMKIGVDEKWINVIETGQTQVVYATEVTALDANHCPGSVMFLFRLQNGRNYLHVGDFRAHPKMHTYPELQNIHIEALFLDTTYCNPRYTFQTQEEVVRTCISFAHKHISNHPKTLIVCGSYTIGKEKVFLGIAEALDCKIWAKPEKRRVITCLCDIRINKRITTNSTEAQIHVLSMNDIGYEVLSNHLKALNGTFTHIVAFRPSGWEASSKSNNFNISVVGNVTIYGVPYSEHSNFLELKSFVQFIQPSEVIQTVNVGNAKTRDQVKKYFDEWLHQPSSSSCNKMMVQSKVSSFFQTKT